MLELLFWTTSLKNDLSISTNDNIPPKRPPWVRNFIKFRATACKFSANVGGHKFIGQFRCLPSKKHYGADNKSTIRNSDTTNPAGPPSTNPVGGDLQQIQVTCLHNPHLPTPPFATILQGGLCWAFGLRAGGREGCKQWRLILPLTFYPSPPEGDWTALTVLQPFQFLQITFFGSKFLRNRMWIGLRWDSMSDWWQKSVQRASKKKDTFGKQPNLIISRTHRKFWQWFVFLCYLCISFDLMTCFCNINLPLLSRPLLLDDFATTEPRKGALHFIRDLFCRHSTPLDIFPRPSWYMRIKLTREGVRVVL